MVVNKCQCLESVAKVWLVLGYRASGEGVVMKQDDRGSRGGIPTLSAGVQSFDQRLAMCDHGAEFYVVCVIQRFTRRYNTT